MKYSSEVQQRHWLRRGFFAFERPDPCSDAPGRPPCTEFATRGSGVDSPQCRCVCPRESPPTVLEVPSLPMRLGPHSISSLLVERGMVTIGYIANRIWSGGRPAQRAGG